jgi:hypothetical protein
MKKLLFITIAFVICSYSKLDQEYDIYAVYHYYTVAQFEQLVIFYEP